MSEEENTSQIIMIKHLSILDFLYNEDFTLLLVFDNTEKRIFDMKPYLKKNTVFEQFMNFDDFKRVYLDDDNCVSWDKNPEIDSEIECNNKVDLSSVVCYVDSRPCSTLG